MLVDTLTLGNQSGSAGGMAAYRQTFQQAVLRLLAEQALKND
jgi:hypothetical protein